MTRRILLLAATIVWTGSVAATVPRAAGAQGPAAAAPAPADQYGAVVNRYCVTCHNQRARTGGLALDSADLAHVAAAPEVWEKVARKLRTGAMPPIGAPRPDQPTYDGLTTWLESELDRAAAAKPNPGQPLVHRLNRAEYTNAIRDLLALDVDVATLLPPDDSSFGFDNVADALGVSPVLLERYLSAAGKISALAVGDPNTRPIDLTYRVRPDVTQTQHVDGLPLGTRGGLLVRHTFPLDGEYVIKPKPWRTTVDFIRGLASPHQVEVSVDGERVHLVTIGGKPDFERLVIYPQVVGEEIEARLQVRVRVPAGPHAVGVTFLEKTAAAPPNILQPYQSQVDPFDSDGLPQLTNVTISGPFNATGSGDTPSRRQIFACRPATVREEGPCARKIIAALARRAYRRPVTDGDLGPLLGFYETGRRQGSFDAGIEMTLRRLLVDPSFIFRVERDGADTAPGTVHRISDVELASRLSFFLWSTIPDEPLLALAEQGKLREPGVVAQQVKRMLGDPRAEALTRNFAGQWLYLRNLRNSDPNVIEFPDFDDNLRQAFQRETELFFESIVREDRNVLDLMTADYTFVNERLARHYGMPNVYGSQFRRVTLTDDSRRGLLGKGSILTVTSLANRTSPVIRGKWILENLLGTPPPPPPATVPPLPENTDKARPLSMRARLEEHRANPTCASCHKVMDPLGFALENFDAVGAWRTREAGAAIDASSQLADGTRVDGPATLRQALLKRPELFVETMTEKLLTYGLGRGLSFEDRPYVRTVLREAGGQDYRFSALIVAIVESVPFQMRMRN